MTAIKVITKAMMPVMRSDHTRDRFSIILPVIRENVTPPKPDPAEVMPLAKLRFLENHWDRMAMLGIQMKPTPMPTRTPWERYKCQAFEAKDAAMKPAASAMTPASIGIWAPNLRARKVTNGATSIAAPKVLPPTKAKSRGSAPGKELYLR